MANPKEAVVRLSARLEKPLNDLIAEAQALRGKVTRANDLEMLISLLGGLHQAAQGGCTPQTWQRRFTLKAAKKAGSRRK